MPERCIFLRCFAAAALGLLAPAVAAAEPAPPGDAPGGSAGDADWIARPVRLGLVWENDGTLPNFFTSNDRYYTNGLMAHAAWRPDWADRAADRLLGPVGETSLSDDSAFGLALTQRIFTSEDITDKVPGSDDRPYAGSLYVSASLQRAEQRDAFTATMAHVQLDAGVVGSWSGAEAVQTFVHSVWPEQFQPRGWGTQLSNEALVNLRARHAWRFSAGERESGLDFQLIPEVSAALGTVDRNVGGSVLVRAGLHMPDDFGPTTIDAIGSATGDWPADRRFGGYVFAQAGGRVVEHDLYLDGNTFQNSRSVTKEPAVGELRFGVVLRLFEHLECSWSRTYLTDEFEAQTQSVSYGTLSVAYRRTF